MPSFDIVSEVDLQEVRNAVANTERALENRWDFRQVEALVTLDEKSQKIKIATESDFQLRQLLELLLEQLLKRGIESKALEIPTEPEHSGKLYSLSISLKQGIETLLAKKIIKIIQQSKLKVQAQIQGDQVRITGKVRDDLQQAIALVRNSEPEQPLQMTNFRD